MVSNNLNMEGNKVIMDKLEEDMTSNNNSSQEVMTNKTTVKLEAMGNRLEVCTHNNRTCMVVTNSNLNNQAMEIHMDKQVTAILMEHLKDMVNHHRWEEEEATIKDTKIQDPIMELHHLQCLTDQPNNKIHHMM